MKIGKIAVTSDLGRETRMTKKEIENIFDQAHGYAIEYLENINDRPVYPDDGALEALKVFDMLIPEDGMEALKMLEMLHKIGSKATTVQVSGRYFGFVNGGAHPPALAARWLADIWDQNAALYTMSPIAGKLEAICESWLVDILGLPKDTAVGLVSGTSTSLSCGFAAARNELLARQGWDVANEGLFGAPEIKVVLGEQAHGTVFKSLAFLGLGKNRVQKIPCDDQGRMIIDQIPELDDKTLLILSAGNVNSGSFDHFREICTIANAANSWVHIDGAFGLWAAASKEKRYLCNGIELADSWSADAHKTLNAPYDCGIIFCKKRISLVSALQQTGSYIQWSENRDNMMYVPEMSRRARGVDLWATLVTMGRAGVNNLVNQLCDRASLFAELLQKEGFEICNDVVFNQILVAGQNPTKTEAILNYVQKSGECWCGGSQWYGKAVIRISVCDANTTIADIERSVAVFVDARDSLNHE